MGSIVYSAGYNCEKFVDYNIQSIYYQGNKDYKHIVVNSCSTDGTEEKILFYKKYDPNIVYYKPEKRQYWLENAVQFLKPKDEDIVFIVDLDDWFYSDDWLYPEGTLSYINKLYKDTNCWLTYGSFMWYSTKQKEGSPYSEHTIKNKLYRQVEWKAVHLQTFKGFLWNNINKEDFKFPNGAFATSSYDQAIMYPMLEMCPSNKIQFVDRLLYVYNDSNPLNCFNVEKKQQVFNEMYFRSKPKYEELSL